MWGHGAGPSAGKQGQFSFLGCGFHAFWVAESSRAVPQVWRKCPCRVCFGEFQYARGWMFDTWRSQRVIPRRNEGPAAKRTAVMLREEGSGTGSGFGTGGDGAHAAGQRAQHAQWQARDDCAQNQCRMSTPSFARMCNRRICTVKAVWQVWQGCAIEGLQVLASAIISFTRTSGSARGLWETRRKQLFPGVPHPRRYDAAHAPLQTRALIMNHGSSCNPASA